jgi:hypothetical protein
MIIIMQYSIPRFLDTKPLQSVTSSSFGWKLLIKKLRLRRDRFDIIGLVVFFPAIVLFPAFEVQDINMPVLFCTFVYLKCLSTFI